METEEVEKLQPVGPAFNADSAFAMTKAQCDFGPRDMNSAAHDRCADWDCRQVQAVWLHGADAEG